MRIPEFSATLYNCRMMTNAEIRRRNLDVLISEAGGVSKFAEVLQKDVAQVSQWRNASLNSKTKRPRGISDDMCREFERLFNRETGWMDHYHPDAPNEMIEVTPNERKLIERYRASPTTRLLVGQALETSFSLEEALTSDGRDAAIPLTIRTK